MVRLFSNNSESKYINDEEFGEIELRRVKGATISVRPATNGRLVVRIPHLVPAREARNMIEKNRQQLRRILQKNISHKEYNDGDLIGKSHHLRIRIGVREQIKLNGLDLIVTLREDTTNASEAQLVRDGVAKALRKEAKACLPRRLYYLAQKTGLHYERVQFTHAKSRWGSCSSTGTISLNIMLMSLPNELVDYVLLHELTHTKHMNHSTEFWNDLDRVCAGAKSKRSELKKYSPFL